MSKERRQMMQLREISEFVRDGTHASFQRVSSGKPLLSAKNITEDGDVVWNSSDSLISDADYRAISRSFRVARGDVLLTIVGSIGRVALFKVDDAVAFQRSVAVIRPREDLINRHFLVHALRTRSVQSDLLRRANATAQAGVYLGELERVSIPVPALAEQHRTTEILDTADEAIRSSERIIAKLRRAKQALLRDLFALGSDPNFSSRGWTTRPLGQLSEYVTYGFTNPMPTTEDGPWLLTAADIGYGYVDFTRARHTSATAFNRNLTNKSRPRPGDILITKDGTLGRVAKLGVDRVCVNQSVAVVRLAESDWSDYLVSYLLSPMGQDAMLRDSGGSTIKHLYISKLAELPIPLPPGEEVSRIVEVVKQWESMMQLESERLAKLRLLKEGLMVDLLTECAEAPPSA